MKNPRHGEVRIGVVGKYVELHESYKSLNEALTHGGIANDVRVRQVFIDSTKLEEGDLSELDQVDAILVPGGFGVRGTEGKILAVRCAREKKIPFFGICLGLQMAVIEFGRARARPRARQLARVRRADARTRSSRSWRGRRASPTRAGRCGSAATPARSRSGTKARELYGADLVQERHRHRFEFNNAYRAQYEAAGMVFSGVNPDLNLVEMIELNNHPYFVGCQFHPEFKSKPFAPHPLFAGFVLGRARAPRPGGAPPGAAVTKLPGREER